MYSGQERRKEYIPEKDQKRRASDLARILGRLEEKMSTFDNKQEMIIQAVKNEVSGMKTILDGNMDLVETNITHIDSALISHVNELRKDIQDLEGGFNSKAKLVLDMNKDEHEDLEKEIKGVREEIEKLDVRIDVLEREPGRKAQKFLKTLGEVVLKIIIPVAVTVILGILALNGFPV
jgi:prefoldin subunit 5